MADSPRQFDFLVLGSGIAGLTFALKVAHAGSVAIITKKSRAESNTNYAQGGIAAVTSEEDSFESHVRDTLDAGGGLCDEEVVRGIVEEGPARIEELIQLGMKFSERESNGHLELDLGREGGHSNRRILHAKDVTGREIERALLAAIAAHKNITVLENHLATDLITTAKLDQAQPNRCVGVYVLDNQTGEVETFSAPSITLATGGCGKVYLYTSNPDIATGDGVAMAYRAGATIANMEFIQFHPTCLPSRGQVVPHQRGGAGRGRRAGEPARGTVHGGRASAQVTRAARRRGPGDRSRDETQRRRPRAA
jgi:L-aspartate oxidase